MSNRFDRTAICDDSREDLRESEVVEIPLLLPGWQVSALETAAHRRGLTAGQMVRSLLREFILGLPEPGCTSSAMHTETA